MSRIDNNYFTYRQTPTTENGTGTIESIKGNTLNWNQLVQNGNFASTSNFLVIGATDFTVSGNIASFSVLTNDDRLQQNMPLTKGHKYLICMDVLNSSPNTMRIFWGQQILVIPSSSSWQRIQAIADTSSLTTATYALGLRLMGTIASGTRATIRTKNWNCFDLTQMGLDSITSVDEFTALFPLSFYPYTQGELISFNGNGIKTVGFNQWDEEWELGTYLNINGSKYNSTSKIRNVNPIRVLPNTSYYYIVGTTSTDEDGVFFYDGNMNFIRRQPISHGSSVSTSFTTPANCSYVNFSVKNTTYNNDICINISDTSKNGTYEPYTESVLSFSLPTLRSANTIYDEVTKEENGYKHITRIGVVDLGSLTWERTTTQGSDYRFFSSGIASIVKKPSSLNDVANIICSKYKAERGNGPNAQEVGVGIHTNGNILIYDTAYASATASDFKTAMNGVYLYYELATPTESTLDLDLTFNIDQGGTEELLPTNTSTPTTTPILCDIFYRGMIPVSVNVYPLGSGTVTGSGEYRYGETATLVATSNDGIYRFLRYEDENGQTLSTDSTYSFKVGE